MSAHQWQVGGLVKISGRMAKFAKIAAVNKVTVTLDDGTKWSAKHGRAHASDRWSALSIEPITEADADALRQIQAASDAKFRAVRTVAQTQWSALSLDQLNRILAIVKEVQS